LPPGALAICRNGGVPVLCSFLISSSTHFAQEKAGGLPFFARVIGVGIPGLLIVRNALARLPQTAK